MARVTQHAKKRIKERIGVSGKGADRQAQLALDRGLSHGQTSGQLYKWVTSIVMKEKYYRDVRLYNLKLFLFNRSEEHKKLITVLPVPSNLHKQAISQCNKHKN